MIVSLYNKNGEQIEVDVIHFSVHQNLRVIMLHFANGLIDCYNMDYIEKFTIPSKAIKGTT